MRAAELIGVFGQSGGEVLDEPAEGEDCRALVEQSAELEFLGRHEAARPEHPSHVVPARARPVTIEINNVQCQGGEVDDQTPVVEIASHPAVCRKIAMQVDQRVEERQLIFGREVGEAPVCRRRVDSLFGGRGARLVAIPISSPDTAW